MPLSTAISTLANAAAAALARERAVSFRVLSAEVLACSARYTSWAWRGALMRELGAHVAPPDLGAPRIEAGLHAAVVAAGFEDSEAVEGRAELRFAGRTRTGRGRGRILTARYRSGVDEPARLADNAQERQRGQRGDRRPN